MLRLNDIYSSLLSTFLILYLGNIAKKIDWFACLVFSMINCDVLHETCDVNGVVTLVAVLLQVYNDVVS